MKITVKCPTRVDLCGGTLDLWPLYAFIPGSKTINAAIDIFTQTELTKRSDSQIFVNITNIKFEKKYSNLEQLIKDKNKALDILKPVLSFFKPTYGFEIKTSSESPVGGGLGGSSSLMVTLVTAFLEASNKKMDPHALVHLAHNLEAQILNTPTGTQDYFPPILGGVNCLSYEMDGIKIEKLNISEAAFNSHFVLVYTGKPHHSGLNNWQVYQKAVEKNKKVLNSLKGLMQLTQTFYEKILQGEFNFKSVFKSEYKYRTMLAKSFSSPEIRRLEKIALKNGAQAIKICGAGGGGCVIVWCEPAKQERVINACQKEKFQVLKANLSLTGIDILRS